MHTHIHSYIRTYIHTYQGINEGDFYTFEGLFQLEQEGSRRCNTMNVLTLYHTSVYLMGDLLIQKMADEIQYILVLKVHTLVHGLFTLSHYQSPRDKCNN